MANQEDSDQHPVPLRTKTEALEKKRAYNREYSKTKRRQRLLLLGLCPQCNEPKNDDGYRCANCYFKSAAAAAGQSVVFADKLKEKFESQGGRCAYTGEPLVIGQNCSLDHILPVSRGGDSRIDNLQWVTKQVNSIKRDILEADFLALIKAIYDYKLGDR